MKKILSLLIVLAMVLSTSLSVFASTDSSNANNSSENREYVIVYDENNVPYKLTEDNGELYISPLYKSKIAGGMGHCPVTKKTFKETFSRSAAVKAKARIDKGASAFSTIGLLVGNWGKATGISTIASLIAKDMTSDAYYRLLTKVVNGTKSHGTFVYETRCTQHLNHGEPIYDYVVQKAYII